MVHEEDAEPGGSGRAIAIQSAAEKALGEGKRGYPPPLLRPRWEEWRSTSCWGYDVVTWTFGDMEVELDGSGEGHHWRSVPHCEWARPWRGRIAGAVASGRGVSAVKTGSRSLRADMEDMLGHEVQNLTIEPMASLQTEILRALGMLYARYSSQGE